LSILRIRQCYVWLTGGDDCSSMCLRLSDAQLSHICKQIDCSVFVLHALCGKVFPGLGQIQVAVFTLDEYNLEWFESAAMNLQVTLRTWLLMQVSEPRSVGVVGRRSELVELVERGARSAPRRNCAAMVLSLMVVEAVGSSSQLRRDGPSLPR
jgi:hypothetical protein